jgi:hypothetical protein
MPDAITLWNERQQMTREGKDPLAGDVTYQDLHGRLVAAVGHPLSDTGGGGAGAAGLAALDFRKAYVEIMNGPGTVGEKQTKARKLFLDTIIFYNPNAFAGDVGSSAEINATKPQSNIRGEGGAKPPAIPRQSVDYLRANPATAAQFDQKYGAGSAARILGR